MTAAGGPAPGEPRGSPAAAASHPGGGGGAPIPASPPPRGGPTTESPPVPGPSGGGAGPSGGRGGRHRHGGPPVDGRVLRLHFACRASLPLGSSLRVTSSTLWAPDSNLRGSGVQEGEAPAGSEPGEDYDGHAARETSSAGGGYAAPHASSVEMVTDPETYPVWRTRTPVVVVANAAGEDGVQRHRYRYMVVTPGAGIREEGAGGAGAGAGGGGAMAMAAAPSAMSPMMAGTPEDEEERDALAAAAAPPPPRTPGTTAMDDAMGDAAAAGVGPAGVTPPRSGGGASTSNDTGEGAFPVMVWEDPFLAQREPELPDRSISVVSLPSVRRSHRSLAELPWRVIDVDVASFDDDAAAGRRSDLTSHGSGEFTPDGVRVDRWNDAADLSFRPYLEDEERKNRAKMEADEMACGAGPEEEEGRYHEAVAAAVAAQGDDGDDAAMDAGPTVSASEAEGAEAAEAEGAEAAGHTKRVFLVCYHLPVILTRDPIDGSWSACWSESLIAKTEQSGVSSQYETKWFGTVRTVPPVSTEEERDAVREVLRPMGCFPLFLDDEVEEQHYLGMCKQVLWPAFHNVDLLDLSASGWGQREMALNLGPGSFEIGRRAMRQVPAGNPMGNGGDGGALLPPLSTSNTDSDWDQSRLDGWWSSYAAVNRMFAEAISAVVRPHDTVWVHDYHLSLLPKMLHDAELAQVVGGGGGGIGAGGGGVGRRTIQMVYFLHIPFPTSQVFRELEHGEEILEGMLHADVVGFHSFDYARHFLNASKRILGLTYESLVGGLIGVRYRGKKVLVSMSNVSIESDIVAAALALPAVREGAAALRARHGSRSIVAAVDVAQRLSGVYMKLLAYERLLTDYPVWHSRVVMVQKCLVPGSRRADEADTLRNIRSLVRRVQDRFGQSVIDFEEVICSSLPIDRRLAIWCASDVLVCTPVREGLNLLPLEYIFARREPASPGVVITSEFSAVCSILNGALRVNPYDVQTFVTSLDKALTMDMNEKEARRARDIDFVSSCPSGLWTRNVLRDLADATAAQHLEDTGDGRPPTPSAVAQSPSGVAAMLSLENEPEFVPLRIESARAAYDATCRRVIVMDFNGTLVTKEPPGKYLKREMLGTTGNKPPPEVVAALADMCADPRNVVFVVSGDTQRNLEDALGHVPGLGLAHSNGACFAAPLRPGEVRRTWHAFDLGVDWDAVKRVALPVLSKYTARTNGSFVKLTHSSIGWSYYCCDPEWGSLQASYLVPELERELHAFDVRFVTLKGVVEVVPRKLNKGLVVKKVLREVAAMHGDAGGIDFVLCMGDDVSDEKMFTSVFSYAAESGDPAVIRDGGPDAVVGGGAAAGAAAAGHPPSAPPQPSSSSPTNAVMEDVSPPPYSPAAVAGVRHHRHPRGGSAPMYAFTVAVGKKATHASYYVDSSHDVPRLLVELSGGGRRGGGAATPGGGGAGKHHAAGVGGSSMSWDSAEGQATTRGGRFA